MGTADRTPLWLDLRKEYIDDNFSKFYYHLSNNFSCIVEYVYK